MLVGVRLGHSKSASIWSYYNKKLDMSNGCYYIMIVCDDEVSEAAMASDQEGENYMFSPFFYICCFMWSLLHVVLIDLSLKGEVEISAKGQNSNYYYKKKQNGSDLNPAPGPLTLYLAGASIYNRAKYFSFILIGRYPHGK